MPVPVRLLPCETASSLTQPSSPACPCLLSSKKLAHKRDDTAMRMRMRYEEASKLKLRRTAQVRVPRSTPRGIGVGLAKPPRVSHPTPMPPPADLLQLSEEDTPAQKRKAASSSGAKPPIS